MSKTGKWITEWLIVPLFGPPIWAMGKLYGIFFGQGDSRKSKKREDRLALAIRDSFAFFFIENRGSVVPDQSVKHPQPFDYAIVVVVREDLPWRLRFILGQGNLRIQVAANSFPNAWEELSVVLDAIDAGKSHRHTFISLPDSARVVQEHLHLLTQAFSPERYPELKQMFEENHARDRAVMKEWEVETNRRLYGDGRK